MAAESSSQALVRRSTITDLSLMPPPPKRIKRPKKVLEEDDYTSALSEIIARDFFPGLLESETQQEYLDALDSKDKAWINSAGLRLESVMTPGRGRRGTALQSVVRGMSGSETPQGGGWAGDTPMSAISDVSQASTATKTRENIDINMSLSAFQAKYTSEDNESFYKLLDKQNEKRAEKYAWMWRGNKLPSKMMIKQKEVETKLLREKKTLVDDGAKVDRLAIQSRDAKPAMAESWKSKPNNNLMFGPEGVEDSVETIAMRSQRTSRAEPKGVVYGNTRLLAPEGTGTEVPASPSLSAIQDAIAGKPRKGLFSDSDFNGGETPRVNGYAFVDDEPEEYNSVPTSKIELPKADATPNPFKMQAQSAREDLHHRMVDRNAKTKRASTKIGMTGRVERTPVPKFPSSPRVGAGAGALTPAGQRLWSKVGRSDLGNLSRTSGIKTPIRSRPTGSGLKNGWTPKT